MCASCAGEARSIVSKLLDNRNRINVTVKRQIWPWRPRNTVCSFFFNPALEEESSEEGTVVMPKSLDFLMNAIKKRLPAYVGGEWTLDDSRQSVGGEFILTSQKPLHIPTGLSLRSFCKEVKESVGVLARTSTGEGSQVFNCASLRLGRFLPWSVPTEKESKLKERLDNVFGLVDETDKEDKAALLAHALWSGSTGYERARMSSMIMTVLNSVSEPGELEPIVGSASM